MVVVVVGVVAVLGCGVWSPGLTVACCGSSCTKSRCGDGAVGI